MAINKIKRNEDGELTYPLLSFGELRAINHEYSSNSYMVDLRYSQNNLELATYINYFRKLYCEYI